MHQLERMLRWLSLLVLASLLAQLLPPAVNGARSARAATRNDSAAQTSSGAGVEA